MSKSQNYSLIKWLIRTSNLLWQWNIICEIGSVLGRERRKNPSPPQIIGLKVIKSNGVAVTCLNQNIWFTFHRLAQKHKWVINRWHERTAEKKRNPFAFFSPCDVNTKFKIYISLSSLPTFYADIIKKKKKKKVYAEQRATRKRIANRFDRMESRNISNVSANLADETDISCDCSCLLYSI